jgi:CelD/BcsL family acetyltransferase involved in cellulose biosynthesis
MQKTPGLRVEKLTTLDEFRAIYDGKDAQVALRTNNIFLSFLWMSEWWQVYGFDYQMHVLVVRDEIRLIGVLPLVLQKTGRGVRYLNFMGAGELTPDDLDILSIPERRMEVLQALAAYLHNTQSEWDVIELDKLPAGSLTVEELEARFRACGLVTDLMDAARCYSTVLPASFDEYLSRLSRSTRHNLERRKRNFETDHPGAEFIQAKTPEQIDRALEALVRLHQARWTKKGYPGAFASKRFYEFHRAIMLQALHAGLLNLYYLQTGAEIIAVEYLFRVGDVVQDYLGGYNEDWAKYSLGNLMVAFSIRMSIDNNVSIFDLLEGDEAYKDDWATEVRKNVCLRVYGANRRSRLERMRFRIVNLIREWIIHHIPKNIRRPIWKSLLRWRAFMQKHDLAK